MFLLTLATVSALFRSPSKALVNILTNSFVDMQPLSSLSATSKNSLSRSVDIFFGYRTEGK